MKTAYCPKNVETNIYTKLVVNSIEKNDINVEDFNTFDLFKGKYEVVNLNWFENVRTNSSFFRMYLGYIWKRIIVLYCRVRKVKIIWTVHNKVAHGNKYSKYSEKLMRLLSKRANLKVIHCYETKKILKEFNPNIKDEEIEYIPHPNYIDAYNEENKIDYKKHLDIKEDEMVFLFVGQVRPYKNVELIIKAAKKCDNKKIRFIIAGKPANEEYKKYIENLCTNTNIDLVLEFIEDEKMISLIKSSDIVILPYSLKSSLNSGSVILAFSLAKTVICPEIGTLKDINDKDLYYSYEYLNENEHFNILQEMINKSYDDFLNNNQKFQKKGELLKQKMIKYNNLDIISQMYKELYYKVLK